MAKIDRFEELEVWKLAREIVNEIYRVTRKQAISKDWGLRDQIQRAAVSVMSNIAEGYERGTNKEFVQFLFVARASAGEVRSLLYVASDQEYVERKTFDDLTAKLCMISKQLKGFINYLQATNLRHR
jgi:four helix bundle protein